MSTVAVERRRVGMQTPAALAGLLVAVVALVEIYAWLSHTTRLLVLRPGHAPMQFNSALCLLLLGLTLGVLPTRWHRWAAVPAGAATVVSGLTVAEYALSRGLGIDRLFFEPWLGGGAAPGRMGLNTAGCIAMVGAAALGLVLAGRHHRVAQLLLGLASSCVAGVALVALFGYASGVSTAYAWRSSTAMAPLTAACLLLLGVGYATVSWAFARGGAAPRWLPFPVGVGGLAATLFLWQALLSHGERSGRALTLDRAAGIVLAIGVVFSALLASATVAVQSATRSRRALAAAGEVDKVLATAYQAVSAETDLGAAFDAFAKVASGVLPYERAAFALVDDDQVTTLAVAGPAGSLIGAGTVTSRSDPLVGAITAQTGPFLVRDTAVEYGDTWAGRTGLRCVLAIPIVMAGAVHAVFSFSSTVPDAFTDDHVALVTAFGRTVGGALYTRTLLRDEQRLNTRLRELDQLKNEFIGVVAHDLRSPMTVIAGYVDMVLGRWDDLDDATKRELLGVASRNTRRLAVLVEDVLQVARIESGEFPYEIAAFDLGLLVKRTCAEMTAAKPDRPVVAAVPDDLPVALADQDRQWRVLTNLLSNAQKFSPDGEPVRVEVETRDKEIVLRVADRGPGIPPEQLPRLFGKFARLATPPNGEKGTGLGLYITKALVEAQGGQIEVESRVGKGTTMRYTVPRADAA